MNLGLKYGIPTSYASGGSLTKEDKLAIEYVKAENKLSTKEVEMAYKTIVKNNEMLEKGLLKVFK